ncbi:hypothetical protein BEWA_014030 [Theileria equi strain WA]|uniref:Uncharacterized protein n=1 Tax=Theileria equi strain WA TaxID=1537102 RepID=L1LC43_THEEQ|nr:hypothetical protein BEWA_014030 [Theileria equi strain WA]EKX72844.1 hypothetical protein BEWA_014030 [Theileria equi strain WA]|eukprot:XP_004832296.1 hypothetical protein BEWA_014030 [Theileria equi strain WA]
MDVEYYKRDDDASVNSWEKVNGNYGPGYTPSDLQNILQRAKRGVDACPKVTIKIEQKTGEDGKESSYKDGNTSIKVTRSEFGSSYYKYIHKINDTPYFTLKDVTYKDGPISVKPKFSETCKVTSVSIYYWKYSGSGQPLLIKIAKEDGRGKANEIWHRKFDSPKSFDWITVSASDDVQLNVLDTLNCELNDVVEISVDVKPAPGNNEATYCHVEHDTKITVRINPDVKFFGFAAHEHYMKSSSSSYKKFHVSGFKEGNTSLDGIDQLPFLNVEYVIVFSSTCDNTSNERALLIYVSYDDQQKGEWFNRKILETVGKDWEEAVELQDKNPHNHYEPNNIEEKLWNLANALGIVCRNIPKYGPETGKLDNVLGGSSGTNSLPGLGGYADSHGSATSPKLEPGQTSEEEDTGGHGGDTDHLSSVTEHGPVPTVQSTSHGEITPDQPAKVISNPTDNVKTTVIVASTLVALALFASVIYISYKYVNEWGFRI